MAVRLTLGSTGTTMIRQVRRRTVIVAVISVLLGLAGVALALLQSTQMRDDLRVLNLVTRQRMYAWAISSYGLSAGQAMSEDERARWVDSLDTHIRRRVSEQRALERARGPVHDRLVAGDLRPQLDSLRAAQVALTGAARVVAAQQPTTRSLADELALRLARSEVSARIDALTAEIEVSADARADRSRRLAAALSTALVLQALLALVLTRPLLRELSARIEADQRSVDAAEKRMSRAVETSELLAAEKTQLAGELVETDGMRRVLAAIVASTDDGVCSVDAVGRVTTWNAGMVRLTGVAVPEALGRTLGDAWPALGAPEIERGIAAALRGRTTRVGRVSVRPPALADVAVSPLREGSPRVTGAVIAMRAVLER
jgi:PAS domain S-box-containing protein